MVDFTKISFKIISIAAEAKQFAIQALEQAKKHKFDEIESLLEQADKKMIEAEKTHMEVIVQEAQGNQLSFSALYMHAEDQLLTIQTLIFIIKELILVQQQFNNYNK